MLPCTLPCAKPDCDDCDLFVGLEGLHVLKVESGPDRLSVTVGSAPAPLGCPDVVS